MLRGRLRGKRPVNYSNLHVIPIGSTLNNKPLERPPMVEPFPSVIPIPIVSTPAKDVFQNNNYRGKGKKARKRTRRREQRLANRMQDNKVIPVLHGNEYRWFNPNIVYSKNNVVEAPPVNESEKNESEEVSDVPPPAEEDFEEVEVASSEGEGKKIPVGFRKNKLVYLSYKKKNFFKPKFYNFSSQRTVVNCLNVDDDDSVDVDVVSEAEYDEYETGEPSESVEKFGKIIEIEEESSNEVTDVEDQVNDEIGEESSHAVMDEVDEDSNHTITIMDEDSNHTITDEKSADAAADDEVDETSNQNAVTNMEDEKSVHDVNDKDKVEEKCTPAVKNDNKVTVPKSEIFKSGIESSDDNLIQGESLIQEKLNTWESHLIGLEYLLEIRDKDKTSVLKYYCTLCDEDLVLQELSEAYVINHVCGRNHVTKYLEKHFPNCEIKIDENSSYDFVFIQKLCEKINKDLGKYFMCITNDDYYAENKLKVNEIIQNGSHLAENDLKFERSSFEKTVDSDLSDNISNIVKDMIKKVMPEDELAAELEEKPKDNKEVSKAKSTDADTKKKSAAPKTFKKHKGNNSISSFLRLSFAASGKLPKSKVSTNKNEKTESNKEQISDTNKTSTEQQIVDTTKTNDVPIVEKPKAENTETVKKPSPKSVEAQVKSTNETLVKPNKSTNEVLVKPNKSANEALVKPNKSTNEALVKPNKSPNEALVKPNKSPTKPAVKTMSSREKLIAKLKMLKGEVSKEEVDDKQTEEKESSGGTQGLKKTPDNSTVLKSQKDVSNVNKNISIKKMVQNKEKVLLKTTTTMHSKHCRKINQVIFTTRHIKVC